MKFNYSASFSDGETINRTTPRVYTHAWKCGRVSGFSGTLALAEKQVASYKASVASYNKGRGEKLQQPVCEIVKVTSVPAEVAKTFKTMNPWKVQVTYRTGTTSWLKAGANRIARYPTEATAQEIADRFAKQNEGKTYKVIRD